MSTHTLIEEAYAHAVVELASSPLQELIGASDAQWAAIAKRLGPRMDEVERVWAEASETAARHVLLVMNNNPRSSLSELYDRRADIRQVLDTPFRRAMERTHELIDEAWEDGRTLGTTAGLQDLRALGIRSANRPRLDEEVRRRLHSDVNRNTDAFRERFRHAATRDDPERLRSALSSRDPGRRARLGVNVAGSHAWSEAKERTLAENAPPGARKVWVCSFVNSCATCMKLHGTRRKLGEPFPATLSFTRPPRVYGSRLNHPPRHPNCRCRIILWVPRMGGTEEMTSYAQEFWEGVKDVLTRRRRAQRSR